MIPYTKDPSGANVPIIRGSHWPPGGSAKLTITLAGGWPSGADGWTWRLAFYRDGFAGAVTTLVTPSSVSILSNDLTIQFDLDDAVTAAFAGKGNTRFKVTVTSVDGTGEEQAWPTAAGYATVKDEV